MAEDLLDRLFAEGTTIAAVDGSRAGAPIGRRQLETDVQRLAAQLQAARGKHPEGSIWVAVDDRYLFCVAALAGLCCGPTALVDSDGPPLSFAALAAACPPALVLVDGARGAAGWARSAEVPVLVVDRSDDGPPGSALGAVAPVDELALEVFTSGTTGAVKCVRVPGPQLMAALEGVAERLRLGPDDVSLSVAPLTHTLGFVTSVLASWISGGSVAFAEPTRSREVLDAIGSGRPTWCAAAPSLHWLLQRTTGAAGLEWDSLRLLRSSAAALPADLAAGLEAHFGVPVITAYAMSEAPGEIASQLPTDVVRGTVGPPTLCQVEIRPAGTDLADVEGGQVWVRGRNVVPTGPDGRPDWFATGDVGVLDPNGHLRLTGRVRDMINMGGLKVWPPEVEAAALRHPEIVAAAAFAVPHKRMGERIGLAVVPGPGSALDAARVRQMLRSELQREKWPAHILICEQLPRTVRGKIDRRRLVRLLDLDGR